MLSRVLCAYPLSSMLLMRMKVVVCSKVISMVMCNRVLLCDQDLLFCPKVVVLVVVVVLLPSLDLLLIHCLV